jgi:hypothetical protein
MKKATTEDKSVAGEPLKKLVAASSKGPSIRSHRTNENMQAVYNKRLADIFGRRKTGDNSFRKTLNHK